VAQDDFTEVELVMPKDEPTVLRWTCECGNADVRVFLGPQVKGKNIHLSMAAKCDACNGSVGMQ